jgi:hypothetical protein
MQCRLAFALSLFLASVTSSWAATPFWGDRESLPVDTSPATLEPGQFVWNPAAAPDGPIVVIVSLDEQLAHVYRNGIGIGWANISAGKPGHETPTGVFVTLQKDKDHHSSKYNNAPMPYTQRLTWDGVALHAGGLPGYPSSHGCVHLPSAFAEALFDVSPKGMTVVVSSEHSAPVEVAHPTMLAPVNPKSGTKAVADRLTASEDYRWEPEKSAEGPLSILMSSADRRLIVFRNGVEIGRAKFAMGAEELKLGSHVYVVQEIVNGKPEWIAVGVPGHEDEDQRPLDEKAIAGLDIPDEFQARLVPLLAPGTAVMATDEPILARNTAVPVTIMANGATAAIAQ